MVTTLCATSSEEEQINLSPPSKTCHISDLDVELVVIRCSSAYAGCFDAAATTFEDHHHHFGT